MRDGPLVLDLFCGAGGAGMGYKRAGFHVIGVDINPQPNYPFFFVQGDALEELRDPPYQYWRTTVWKRFFRKPDLIHASPPCQSYLNLGAVNRKLGRKYEHVDLIAQTRDLLEATGIPYVIENVADAKKSLIDPVRICGTGLDMPLRRHRLFESNLPITGIPCNHGAFTEQKYWTGWRPNGEVRLSTVVQVYGNAGGREHWPAAMGIDWMTNREMCEAIPPSYTEHIGAQLMTAIGARTHA